MLGGGSRINFKSSVIDVFTFLALAYLFLIHFQSIWAIRSSPLLSHGDLTFDIDHDLSVQRWISLTGEQFAGTVSHAEFLVRHPAGLFPRLLLQPFRWLGFETVAITAVFLSIAYMLSCALVVKLSRAVISDNRLASLVGIIMCMSAAPLVFSATLDSFTFSLPLLLYVFLRLIKDSSEIPGQRVSIAMAFAGGITITHLALPFIWASEVLRRKRAEKREVISWAIRLSVFLIVMLVIHALIFQVWGMDVRDGLRRSYWIAASEEKAGLLRVVSSLIGYPIFSPNFDVETSSRHWLGFIDFRLPNYTFFGAVGTFCALFLTVAGGCFGFLNKDKFAVVSTYWIGFSVLLHLAWQSKGSVFLFSAHTAPAVLVLVFNGIEGLTQRARSAAIKLLIKGGVSIALIGGAISNIELAKEYISMAPLVKLAHVDSRVRDYLCGRIKNGAFMQPEAVEGLACAE